eukprot:TRINITY_DN4610_c0_g2_i5.p2 TRINITY_DN4610_c0_g2~~TRINITY_DN4610_c0_g2_i5.p2  ORF type:complete len:244 (-),score=50.72 TRINITY_DN4610_c0_g2_i5:860-1501(-)
MCIRDRYQRRVHGAPGYDFTLPIFLKGNEIPVYVYKRPGVDFFLRRVTKLFEVVIYTASLSDYANPVIDRLDPERQIPFRLFREHCTLQEGIYVKDLDRLGRDLKDVIIIDNSPNSFKLHQGNAIRVENFIDDREDRELLEMLPFVEFLAEVQQHPSAIRQFCLFRCMMSALLKSGKSAIVLTSPSITRRNRLKVTKWLSALHEKLAKIRGQS